MSIFNMIIINYCNKMSTKVGCSKPCLERALQIRRSKPRELNDTPNAISPSAILFILIPVNFIII